MSDALLKRYESLQARAQRLADIQQVEKVFDTYLQYCALQHEQGVLDTFALDLPDVSVEEGYSEVYEGSKAVKGYFAALVRLAGKNGILWEQQAVCPVIEIAGDGKTAKLVCFARGVKCIAPAELQTYLAGKYYVDFTKQADRRWKIWHLHWFMTYETRVKEGFLYNQTNNNREWQHPDLQDVFVEKPNKPATYWPVLLNPVAPADYVPEAPEPYQTYDGITALKRTRILQHYWDRAKFEQEAKNDD